MRIHPIREMDTIPTWVSLQNRTLANPGGGWSKLRPQTPAEEKTADKRRKAMVRDIRTKEQDCSVLADDFVEDCLADGFEFPVGDGYGSWPSEKGVHESR